jgi:predicted outer membrane protein
LPPRQVDFSQTFWGGTVVKRRSGIPMLAAAVMVPMFIACAGQAPLNNSASGVLSPASNAFVLPTLKPSEMELLNRMTDPNILGHIATGDSVEIVMAGLVNRYSKSDTVLGLARVIIGDHSNSLARGRDIAKNRGIGMQTVAGELKLSHMGPWVDSVGPQISEMNIDHNYVMSQVEMHEHMLAEMNALLNVAKDSAVRAHIQADIPVMQQHLRMARDLAVHRKYMRATDHP